MVERMNKLCCIDAMEYYAAVKINELTLQSTT